ncbi:hypothetical protein [Longimicrobium sp.]|uniref:hypothetical protein n=1 Tax=Longimicrobium sp. TaxID=2029185 RepID=UPI003B3A25EE
MARYYYGTVPVLAWIINHYFYARTHYAWLAAAFHPHGENPGSSNPYALYGHFYEPWAERDRYSRFINDYRRSLAAGVAEKEAAGTLDNITAARLRRLCRLGSIELFYPVLYRVDINAIPPARRTLQNSGLEGSHEVLVKDLRESEFELLFTDNQRDDYFPSLVLGELEGTVRMHPMTTLAMLETKVVT